MESSLNILLILVVLLYIWEVDIDIRFIIAVAYLELTQTSMIALFAKIVNGWNLFTIFVKKLNRRFSTKFEFLPTWEIKNAARMTLHFASENYF